MLLKMAASFTRELAACLALQRSDWVSTSNTKPRLLSLDALRGMDMFWILGGQSVFAALLVLTGWQGWKAFEAHTVHSEWHGFTFYDLIFPLFIFLSGVAMGLSPKRIDHLTFSERIRYYQKAVKRLLLLCFFGVLYNHGWGVGMPMDIDSVRIASVLSRIAIAWFVCAMLVWHTSLKTLGITGVALLLIYWIWLAFIPVPGGEAGDFSKAGSWNAYVDQLLLPGMIYKNGPLDPEGILSNIPAVVNAIAGVFAGQIIAKAQNQVMSNWRAAGLLALSGGIALGAGWLWDLIFPVNKVLWTSSFVLVTVGWSALLLSLFYTVVDILKLQRWAYPFIIIGANSIIIYLASSLIQWSYVSKSLFGGVIKAVPADWAPLTSVAALLVVQLAVLHWLYKRKILISV